MSKNQHVNEHTNEQITDKECNLSFEVLRSLTDNSVDGVTTNRITHRVPPQWTWTYLFLSTRPLPQTSSV